MAKPPTESPPEDILIGSLSEVLQRAAAHYNKAEYRAAAAICNEVIANDPDNPEALHILGHVASRTGNRETAIGYFVRAVTAAPTDPRFNRSFSMALEETEKIQQAIHAWSQYLTLVPDDVTAETRLAHLLSRNGEHGAAANAFSRASAHAPDDNEIRYAMANEQFLAGRFDEAIATYETVLRGREDWAACHNGMAAALRQDRQHDRAIAHARRAAALEPGSAEIWNNLGLALLEGSDDAEAIAALERASRLRPDDAEILNNLGVALGQRGQRDRAQRCFEQALQLRPRWPEGLLNLANLQRQKDELDTAVETYLSAIAEAPDDYRIYGSLALTHLNRDDPTAAITAYEKALSLAPDDPELHKGLGIAQLSSGDFRNGWQNYEWRLRSAGQRTLDMPHWHGEALGTATILVHAEQGFGDTLQFCRYLELLAGQRRPEQLIFECQRPLYRLLSQIDCVDAVVPRGDPLPAADWQVPLLSLPGIFETTLETIPARRAYLRAPKEETAAWQRRLESGLPKIGIVWAGNPLRQDDEKRSCPLPTLVPVTDLAGITFYSLQIDADPADAEWLADRGITDLSKEIGDFTDTAAIVSALDLVITVDTAMAHLSGALGIPVWVLLGKAADWRYLTGRSDSPWYPGMRLFRQESHGDWSGLAIRVAERLADRFNL